MLTLGKIEKKYLIEAFNEAFAKTDFEMIKVLADTTKKVYPDLVAVPTKEELKEQAKALFKQTLSLEFLDTSLEISNNAAFIRVDLRVYEFLVTCDISYYHINPYVINGVDVKDVYYGVQPAV